MLSVEIRPILDSADIDQLETIQQIVAAPIVIPGDYMRLAGNNGNMLIGAYRAEKLVGFAFGTIGLIPSGRRIDPVAAARLKLVLERLIVLPAFQNEGVGSQLMIATRDFAQRLGLRLITFSADALDPLQGWLFIGKLGGISQEHSRNFYGTNRHGDRLIVEWWITNNRVKKRTNNPRKPLQLPAFIGAGGVVVSNVNWSDANEPFPPEQFVNSVSSIILFEIPESAMDQKTADVTALERWQTHARLFFEHYFERNYIITDFVRQPQPDGDRAFYVLTQQNS
jgi:predicted GNAT superfamily acetyltransferase